MRVDVVRSMQHVETRFEHQVPCPKVNLLQHGHYLKRPGLKTEAAQFPHKQLAVHISINQLSFLPMPSSKRRESDKVSLPESP